MIVRPDLECESPYVHGLWYFYLSVLDMTGALHRPTKTNSPKQKQALATGPHPSLDTTPTPTPQEPGQIMWAKAYKTDHLEMDRKRCKVTQSSFSWCQEISM